MMNFLVFSVGVPGWTLWRDQDGWSSLGGSLHPAPRVWRFWRHCLLWPQANPGQLERCWLPYKLQHERDEGRRWIKVSVKKHHRGLLHSSANVLHELFLNFWRLFCLQSYRRFHREAWEEAQLPHPRLRPQRGARQRPPSHRPPRNLKHQRILSRRGQPWRQHPHSS